MIKGCVSVGKICDCEIFRVTETIFINLRGPSTEDEKIAEVCRLGNWMLLNFETSEQYLITNVSFLFQIKKVLNSGTFYFSWGGTAGQMDLTLCEQKRNATKETDNRFFW